MMKYWLILFAFACGTTQQTSVDSKSCPTCPPSRVTYVHDTAYLTVHDITEVHDTSYYAIHDTSVIYGINTVTVHDTTVLTQYDTTNIIQVVTVLDTANKPYTVYLHAVVGDNYPQLQAAADAQIADPNLSIVLYPEVFPISNTVVFAKIVNGQYRQCTPKMRGWMNAKNVPDQFTTKILKTFADGPAIAVQQAKGGYISDLTIEGQYRKSSTFNQAMIDTLADADWNDPNVRSNPSSPDCGIAVDFASDPAYYAGSGYQMYPRLTQYYLPGMSRSGSTAVNFSGLQIRFNLIGFIITPSNQQNGEIIHLDKSRIDYCKTAYAMCQAQSKQCEVKDFECWGNVRTVFDNLNWGFRHGDGAETPMIQGCNIAGFTYQLFWMVPGSFNGNADRVYAEGPFKFGMINAGSGFMITNSVFDFQVQGPGIPSPDYYMWINNVISENCIYRLYSGYNNRYRITMDGNNNEFKGGQMNWPLMSSGRSDQHWYPRMIGVASYTSNARTNSNDYDSTGIQDHNYSTIHINKNNWTAWIKGSWVGGPLSSAQIGSMIVCDRFSIDHLIQQYDYIVGYVKSISSDTLYIDNVGVGINDGENIAVRIMTLKQGYGY